MANLEPGSAFTRYRFGAVAARPIQGQGTAFRTGAAVESRRNARFQTSVRCDEPAGLVTENAFLIFHAVWLGEPWRIFARVRVEVESNREPKTVVELITTQKIGFSGVAA